MKGTVKFYNAGKHFGFIAGDDGNEYFVHSSGLTEGTELRDNDTVQFDSEQGDRGLKAVNVTKGSGPAAKTKAPVEEDVEDSVEDDADDSESDDDSEE
jgi:CspA family cold shock protein